MTRPAIAWLCAAGLAILPVLASAAPNDAYEIFVASLDHPVAVRTLPGPPEGAAGPSSIRCTYYPDLMVRETDFDSAGSHPSLLVRQAPGAPPPACTRGPIAGGIKPADQDDSFTGRRGSYLIFEYNDPSGPQPFDIVDATTGKEVYSDTLGYDGFRSAELAQGGLRLRYQRAVQATCSVGGKGQACWASLAPALIPRAIAALPPPVAACRAVTDAQKDPPNSAEIITYDADVIVAAGAKPRTLSRGAPGCVAPV